MTTMSMWLFAALLVLQGHLAASYIIPLDREAPGSIWRLAEVGLAVGNRRRQALGPDHDFWFPVPAVFLAVTTAGVFILAALAVMG